MTARSVGEQLARGSARILRGVGPTLWPGELGEAIARWMILSLFALVAVAAIGANPGLMWFLVLGAPVVAYGAGRAPKEDQPDDEEHLAADELVTALHAVAAPHAHLAFLAEHLDTSPARVRDGLALAGIPVAAGVRMKGRGVSTGVRAADIPPLSSPTVGPLAPVVVAGQGATTTATTPVVDRHEWGATITDPADQHRRYDLREEVNGS